MSARVMIGPPQGDRFVHAAPCGSKPARYSVSDVAELSRLLDEARMLDAVERQAWLASPQRGKACLAPEVARLLDEAVHRRTFMAGLPALDDAEALHPHAQVGDRIGRYRLTKQIGRGGNATVWLASASERDSGQVLAIKLPTTHGSDTAGAARLATESRILATLDHPRINRLIEAGVDASGRPFLALEYIVGEPITDHCRRLDLPLRARMALFLQLTRAVSYAHRRQVLHRDLKPANILVTEDRGVVLLDFGIAKLLESSDAGDLTRRWGRPLTPAYASPEQRRGEPLGITSDVYSLGVILHELATGMGPRLVSPGSARPSEFELPSRLAKSPEARKTMRGSFDAIVMKALRDAPGRRYPSADELAEDVRRFMSGRRIDADVLVGVDRTVVTARRQQPPRYVDLLIGRETDLEALTTLVRSERLVTVVGPGGVGKTSLAQALAADLDAQFADGTLWVDLAAASDERQVAAVVANAAESTAARGSHETLFREIGSRHVLLVLDNCEHVAAAAARMARRLLERSSSLRILTTSRVPLDLASEQLFRLAPLAVPSSDANLAAAREAHAFQLLERLAGRRADGFSFHEADVYAGIALCRRLDGLPLAIERASALVAYLGPQAYLAAFESGTCDTGSGEATDRQRSMADVWGHSFSALSPLEQHALLRLSKQPSTFDLAFARRMWAPLGIDAPRAAAVLSALAAKSMVHIESTAPRGYRLLETARQFLCGRHGAFDDGEQRVHHSTDCGACRKPR